MLNLKKFSVTALALAAGMTAVVPALADDAQGMPSYAQPDATAAPATVPTYARPVADQEIQGRITSYDGRYKLTVRDTKGYMDTVLLHQGTIINPTGLRLEQGMVVTVVGNNAGTYFAAREVDTPYIENAGVPYYLGHRWDYYGWGYGPEFFFGRRWR